MTRADASAPQLVLPRGRGRPLGDQALRAAALLPARDPHRRDPPPLGPAEEPVPALALLVAGALPGLPRGRRPPGTGAPRNPGPKFDGENRPSAGRLASRLVTGIRLRNFLTVVNNYYDDMAWLALATLRLDKLAEDTRKHTGRGAQRQGPAEPDPAVRLRFHGRPGRRHILEHEARLQEHARHRARWPSTTRGRQPGQGAGPARLAGCQALRARPGPVPGRPADFRRRAKWCWKRPSTPTTRGPSSAPCWNSGASATSGGRPRWWTPWRATSRVPAPLLGRTAAVLRCEGTGDGGLFTGILVRYLALAAVDERLPGRNPGHGGARW